MILSKFFKSRIIPLPRALPTRPVPAPRGVTEMFFFDANRRILIISFSFLGKTMTRGFTRYELASTE